MNDDTSLDRWMDRLGGGDEAALGRVLLAYEPYLRIAVRRRLSRKLRAKFDSADVVQSVFADVIDGFRRGAWKYEGRPQLVAFLRRVAWRRLADRCQAQAARVEREEPPPPDAAGPVDLADPRAFRPSEEARGRELWERMLRACPAGHREVVRLRAAGYRLAEIAERTGLHEGSVRRILYELARRLAVERRTIGGGSRGEDSP
jgi:RNA polymerase sigma-70 factor (ECF subfamily)